MLPARPASPSELVVSCGVQLPVGEHSSMTSVSALDFTTAPVAVQTNGGSLLLLRFDFRGRVGPAGIEDRSRSWFDPAARGPKT